MDPRNLKSNLAHVTHYDLIRHSAGKKRKWKERNEEDVEKPKENFPSVRKSCSERCKLNGCTLLPLEHLQVIYKHFFHMTKDEKNLFRDLCMSYKPANSRERGEWRYEFPLKGVKYQVCKMFFCSVLDISSPSVDRIQKRILDGQFFPRNLQGVHQNRSNRIDPDDIELAKFHINNAYEFMTPHYGRTRHADEKKFLPSHLTFDQIYHDFCSDYGPEKMGRTSFHNIFATENVQIGLPPEDTCDVCFKAHLCLGTSTDPIECAKIKSDQENHLKRVEEARHAFKADVEVSGEDVHVWSVDVQQTFQLPQLPVSTAWYLCKFKVHNFCIHDEKAEQGYMYLWTEVDAKKGANEIGSCIIRHVENHFERLEPNKKRELIVWSDRCRGQNNNYENLCLFLEFTRKGYFSKVTQKFFVSGHSYMSCDRNFGIIESKNRKRQVHTPIQLRNLISSAKVNKPFVVTTMEQEHFIDMSVAKRHFSRPSTLKVSQSLSFEQSLDFPNAIKSRESHKLDSNWLLHRVRPNLAGTDLHSTKAYSNLFSLKKNKVVALKKLMGFLTPSEREFYIPYLTTHDDDKSDDESS